MKAWFSRLKNEFPLSPEEYEEFKRVFRERGEKMFADWLKYYNNLDVGPFLEALEKMRGSYSDLGVNIFKDAVSLPDAVSSARNIEQSQRPKVI